MSRLVSRTRWLLTAIIVVAAFFRFYRLDQLPPGFQFDIAFKTFDILRLLQGQFAIFFPAYTGREPLYHYLSMPYVALFGPNPIALKLSAAIIGWATIPLLYKFTQGLFRSTSIALAAALFAAVSPWHIFFSRAGYRVILLVPLTILMFWMLWRALNPDSSAHRARDFVLAGLFCALAIYTYPSARVFPLVLLAFIAYVAWTDREHRSLVLKGTGLMFLVAALVVLPLATYFAFHPNDFLAHPTDVSIFAAHGVQPVNVGGALTTNALHLAGMFFVAGDASPLRNIPNLPVFDPLVGLLFLAGVAVLVAALVKPKVEFDRRRAVLLILWLGLAVGISLLSDDAPNFSRMLFALPAIMIIPALGAQAVWNWGMARLQFPSRRRTIAGGVLIAVLAYGSVLGFQDYFQTFAKDPGTYYAFDTDKVETANWVNQTAPSSHLYLAPLWAQNGTISLMTRLAPVKSFESRDTIVLPSAASGKDAIYGFPLEQDRKAQMMAERLGGLGTLGELPGSNGGKLLRLLTVPASNLPTVDDPLGVLAHGGDFVQPRTKRGAVWADGFELLGSTVNPEGPGGRNLTVTLFFHAIKPISKDYTFSIKVRDERDRVWGQEDKWAGDNSYATRAWGPGDVVIEKFYPGLAACAPGGDYTVSVEAYDPETMQALALARGETKRVELGGLHAEPSLGNRIQDLEPNTEIEKQIGKLSLIGYTLSAGEVKPGDEVSLSLFWGAANVPVGERVAVRLRDSASKTTDWVESDVKLAGDGRGLCSFFDLKVPAGVPSGRASIMVNNVKVAEINLNR